jgi:drug/metabolite transporter (DMT)-like permease
VREKTAAIWSRFKNHLTVSAGVVLISFSPLVVKAADFSATMGAFYRAVYATGFLALMSVLFHRGEYRPGNRRWVGPSIAAGVFLGVDFAIWHKSILYIGAGPATFLGNAQVVFMTIFAAIFFKERIPRVFAVCLVVISAGLYLLLPPSPETVTRPVGYLLGLTVGVTYAGMLVCQRIGKIRSGPAFPRHLSLTLIFAVSAVTIALWNVLFERQPYGGANLRSHLLMAATAFGAQAAGWSLITRGITALPAHEGSLLLTLQPVLATLWGVMGFAEPFGPVQAIGVALAGGGIVYYQARYATSRLRTEEGYVE